MRCSRLARKEGESAYEMREISQLSLGGVKPEVRMGDPKNIRSKHACVYQCASLYRFSKNGSDEEERHLEFEGSLRPVGPSPQVGLITSAI